MVDVVRELGIEVAQRVVGKGGEMDDRVHALEVGGLHLTHVLLDRVDGFAPGAEGRPPVQVGVETDDLMAGRSQVRGHDSSDVAAAAGDQDPHESMPRAGSIPERQGGAARAKSLGRREFAGLSG
jgi:hypothetical protein